MGVSGLIEGQRRPSLGSGALPKSETPGACESALPSEALPVSHAHPLGEASLTMELTRATEDMRNRRVESNSALLSVCDDSVMQLTPGQRRGRLPQHGPEWGFFSKFLSWA